MPTPEAHTYRGVGHTIEEACFGPEDSGPRRPVTLALADGVSLTGMWRLDRRNIEWVVDKDQQVWVRISTVTRFKVAGDRDG